MGISENIIKISPRELRKKMDEGEAFVLLDILINDHFNRVHLPGARNACVFEVVFLENVGKIVTHKSQDIVMYGSSDKTMDAPTAAEKLLRAGYEHVSVLDGGIRQWTASGFEVEGEAADVAPRPTIAPPTEDRTYTVDTEESVIEWAGRNPNTRHHGTLKLSSGELVVKQGVVTGSFDINMKSIKNLNLAGDPLQSVLVSHLMSDDFFFVEKFPKATFTIDEATLIGEQISSPNVEVRGTLELRGVRRDLEFEAVLTPLDDGGITAEAHFDFDRTK